MNEPIPLSHDFGVVATIFPSEEEVVGIDGKHCQLRFRAGQTLAAIVSIEHLSNGCAIRLTATVQAFNPIDKERVVTFVYYATPTGLKKLYAPNHPTLFEAFEATE